ncbi:MAG: tetratricopeptide repeat protein [Candidatus Firestonebacteria bacterium]|nr:tetratricopeptide repeat protein [Candidatus Firestonebacteria bacterium]
MRNKINKFLASFLILIIIFTLLISNPLCAEQVTGKVIWVSPFFGFIYIRLDDDKIANLGSELEIYLKANNKTGKIDSITSYKDVTICKVEPSELVRQIRKGDTVSGNIKLSIATPKRKRLISDTIIAEYEQQQKIRKEIESSVTPEQTIETEKKIQEELEKKRIEEKTMLLKDEVRRKEEESKRKEEEENNKMLNSLTAEKWFDKGETAGDPKFKIEYYKNALKLNNNYTEAHYKLGTVYQENGNLGDALAEYIEVERIDKKHVLGLNNTADIYKRLGFMDQALETIKKAADFSPTTSIVWVTMGEIYEAMNEKQKAIEAYSHAIDDSKWKSYVTNKISELQK